MTIFIGADHNAFDYKNKLVEYLQEKNIRVEDMGNYKLDPEDDHPIFAKKVAEAVLQNPTDNKGIVLCGSGIGVSIAANRYKGIRAGLCQSTTAAKHGRTNDDINVLALPSEYVPFEEGKKIVDTFLETEFIKKEKYIRRSNQLDGEA